MWAQHLSRAKACALIGLHMMSEENSCRTVAPVCHQADENNVGIRPHGELLLLSMQKKPTFAPDCEAFNSYIGDGFLVPELKDESEASKDEQADSSSENNVGDGALFVIGLHGSGDTIALFLRDWEVAKAVFRCHIALDMLCQELYEVARRRGWFGF